MVPLCRGPFHSPKPTPSMTPETLTEDYPERRARFWRNADPPP